MFSQYVALLCCDIVLCWCVVSVHCVGALCQCSVSAHCVIVWLAKFRLSIYFFVGECQEEDYTPCLVDPCSTVTCNAESDEIKENAFCE